MSYGKGSVATTAQILGRELGCVFFCIRSGLPLYLEFWAIHDGSTLLPYHDFSCTSSPHPPFQCTHLCVRLSVHGCGCVCVLHGIFCLRLFFFFLWGGDQVWFNDWLDGNEKRKFKTLAFMKAQEPETNFKKNSPLKNQP